MTAPISALVSSRVYKYWIGTMPRITPGLDVITTTRSAIRDASMTLWVTHSTLLV